MRAAIMALLVAGLLAGQTGTPQRGQDGKSTMSNVIDMSSNPIIVPQATAATCKAKKAVLFWDTQRNSLALCLDPVRYVTLGDLLVSGDNAGPTVRQELPPPPRPKAGDYFYWTPSGEVVKITPKPCSEADIGDFCIADKPRQSAKPERSGA